MKILVLYSEMAGYFLACVRHHVAHHGGEFHIVRWPVNPEAPFRFNNEKGIRYYERRDLDDTALLELSQHVNPDLVYIAGWIDRPYLKIGRYFRKQNVPVIAAFDAQWQGTTRQKLASTVSGLFLRPSFSHAWVPGLWQYEYARRLGFSREQIRTGMYAADTQSFEAARNRSWETKENEYPHRFLYVGRLHEIKGLAELWDAWKQLKATAKHDWTLDVYGAGPLQGKLPELPGITVRQFVQPDELPYLADTAGIYILPSRHDPWAVTIHEFAAAGMPLIASDQVGATTAFLRHGYNGWVHKAQDSQDLLRVMRQAVQTPDDVLRKMGRRSFELSRQISPATWCSTLNEIANS